MNVIRSQMLPSAVAAMCAVCLIALRGSDGSVTSVNESVTAREFVLVDGQDNVIGRLSSEDGMPMFTLGRPGDERALVRIGRMPDGRTVMEIGGKDRPLVGLQQGDAFSGMVASDADGERIVNAGLSGKEASIVATSGQSVVQCSADAEHIMVRGWQPSGYGFDHEASSTMARSVLRGRKGRPHVDLIVSSETRDGAETGWVSVGNKKGAMLIASEEHGANLVMSSHTDNGIWRALEGWPPDRMLTSNIGDR